jgi:hypothetical protein
MSEWQRRLPETNRAALTTAEASVAQIVSCYLPLSMLR